MDVEFEQIERVVEALQSGGDFTITLPSGRIYAARKGSEIRIFPKEKSARIKPFDYALLVPGSLSIPEIGMTMDADVTDKSHIEAFTDSEAWIDAESVAGKPRVRSPRPGDRIRPLGMSGCKKLQDVLPTAKYQEPSARERRS